MQKSGPLSVCWRKVRDQTSSSGLVNSIHCIYCRDNRVRLNLQSNFKQISFSFNIFLSSYFFCHSNSSVYSLQLGLFTLLPEATPLLGVFWKSALCAWQIIVHPFPTHVPTTFVFSPKLYYFCVGNSEVIRHTGVYSFFWRTGGSSSAAYREEKGALLCSSIV